VDGVEFHISYESRPLGRGTEALTTIWKEDGSGQKKVITIFRNVDTDGHLGAVSPPLIVLHDLNGDGKNDLCRGESGIFVDLGTETVIESSETRLPYLYRCYIRWHYGGSFSFPRYTYVVPIAITALLLLLLLLGVNYSIQAIRAASARRS